MNKKTENKQNSKELENLTEITWYILKHFYQMQDRALS